MREADPRVLTTSPRRGVVLVRRREVPDPGAGRHRADPAAAAGHAPAPEPRLPPQRHHKPLGPPRRRLWQGHRQEDRPPPVRRIPGVPERHRQGGAQPTSTCTSWSTTSWTHKAPTIRWLLRHPADPDVLQLTSWSAGSPNSPPSRCDAGDPPLGQGAHQAHPHMHRQLKRRPQALRLAQNRTRDP